MGTVTIHEGGGYSLNGRDAVEAYRLATLRSGLKLYANTGMLLTRGMTASRLLALAGEATGKRYKRGQHMVAYTDLGIVIDDLKAQLTYIES